LTKYPNRIVTADSSTLTPAENLPENGKTLSRINDCVAPVSLSTLTGTFSLLPPQGEQISSTQKVISCCPQLILLLDFQMINLQQLNKWVETPHSKWRALPYNITVYIKKDDFVDVCACGMYCSLSVYKTISSTKKKYMEFCSDANCIQVHSSILQKLQLH